MRRESGALSLKIGDTDHMQNV